MNLPLGFSESYNNSPNIVDIYIYSFCFGGLLPGRKCIHSLALLPGIYEVFILEIPTSYEVSDFGLATRTPRPIILSQHLCFHYLFIHHVGGT
jgi:hypothetical protein